jgi:pyrroline-5-carboxylate reductase
MSKWFKIAKTTSMMYEKIAIIGAGNMGAAIARGISKANLLEPASIVVSDIDQTKLKMLGNEGFTTATGNQSVAEGADMVITAVKPYYTLDVLKQVAENLTSNQLLVVVAAGISTKAIREVISRDIPLFLAMPNTAIAICESMTCLSTPNAKKEDINTMVSFFDRLGKTFVVDESLMGASTVLAACGTAFALRFMRAAMTGGVEMGFKPDVARLIAAQMVKGASQLMFETNTNPEDEIDKVTTPKGITIKGLNEMEHHGFSSSVIKGMLAAYEKVEEK